MRRSASCSAIYQWDVAAMMWFAKYMHRSFETVGTLENFYVTSAK